MTSRQTEPLLRVSSDVCRGSPTTDSQLVNVGVEDLVHEANAWRLVWKLLWELDVDLPDALRERSYTLACCLVGLMGTFRRDCATVTPYDMVVRERSFVVEVQSVDPVHSSPFARLLTRWACCAHSTRAPN